MTDSYRRRRRAALIVGTVAAAIAPLPSALAASFDCSQAAGRVEQLVCADTELGALDSELARVYAESRDSASPQGAARLKQDQLAWLKQRDACTASACVADAYRARIAALGGSVPSARPAAGAEDALGPVQVERGPEQVRITQTGPDIEIEAVYPVLPGDSAAARAGEAAIARRVDAVLDDFRSDYRDLLASGEGGHVGAPWSLQLSYGPPYETPRFWAVDGAVYRYTGGAHGGEEHLPMVIARTDGRVVPPAELFRPGSDWLGVLSDYCYEALSQKAPLRDDEGWLRQGTAPTAENYQVLLPRPDGLQVTFEQYQIGPYAIGVHRVVVPYSELGAVLNPMLFDVAGDAGGGAAR